MSWTSPVEGGPFGSSRVPSRRREERTSRATGEAAGKGREGPGDKGLHGVAEVAPQPHAPDQEGPQGGRRVSPRVVQAEGRLGRLRLAGPPVGRDDVVRRPPAAAASGSVRAAPVVDGPVPPRPRRARRPRRVGHALRGPRGEGPRRLRPRVPGGDVGAQARGRREGDAPVAGEARGRDAVALALPAVGAQVVVGTDDDHPTVVVLLPPDTAVPGVLVGPGPSPGLVVGLAVGRVPEGSVEVEGVEEGEDGPRVRPRSLPLQGLPRQGVVLVQRRLAQGPVTVEQAFTEEPVVSVIDSRLLCGRDGR